jgi:hypothetical protein
MKKVIILCLMLTGCAHRPVTPSLKVRQCYQGWEPHQVCYGIKPGDAPCDHGNGTWGQLVTVCAPVGSTPRPGMTLLWPGEIPGDADEEDEGPAQKKHWYCFFHVCGKSDPD